MSTLSENSEGSDDEHQTFVVIVTILPLFQIADEETV